MLKELRKVPMLIFLGAVITAVVWCGFFIQEEPTTIAEVREDFNDKYEVLERISDYCVQWPQLENIESDGTYVLATPVEKIKKSVTTSIVKSMTDARVSMLRCEKSAKGGAGLRTLRASQIYDRATGYVFAGTASGFTKIYGTPIKVVYNETTQQGTVRADPACANDCWYLFTFH